MPNAKGQTDYIGEIRGQYSKEAFPNRPPNSEYGNGDERVDWRELENTEWTEQTGGNCWEQTSEIGTDSDFRYA